MVGFVCMKVIEQQWTDLLKGCTDVHVNIYSCQRWEKSSVDCDVFTVSDYVLYSMSVHLYSLRKAEGTSLYFEVIK